MDHGEADRSDAGRQGEDAVRVAYDDVADSYADHFPSTEPEQALDLTFLEHFVRRSGGRGRVLDAGCGAGRLLPVLAGWASSVEGVDLSSGMVRRARRDHPAFRTTVASLAALPYADATFDAYVSWYSTVHTPDHLLPLVLAEARRVLRDGGVAVLGLQSGEGTVDVSPTYRQFGHEVALVRYLRPLDQVVDAVEAAGLQVVARLEREPVDAWERDHQAFVAARR